MEKSTNYNFNLPNSANDEMADINDISDNFRIVDEKIKAEIEKKQDKFASVSHPDPDGNYTWLNIDTPSLGVYNSSRKSSIGMNDNGVELTNVSGLAKINVNQKNIKFSKFGGDIPVLGVATPVTAADTSKNITESDLPYQSANKKYVDDVKSYANNSFANALKGSASGEAVRLSGITPNEHTLGVKVSGKNLLPNPNVHAYNYSLDYKKYNNTDEIFLTAGTYSLSASANCPTLQFWNKETKQRYTVDEAVSAYSTNTYYKIYDGRALGRSSDSVRNMWFTLKIDALITLNSGYSEATSQECQIEEGSVATSYTPYISLTTVTVTRCGKNLTTPQQVYKGAADYSEEIFENKNCVRFSSSTTIKNSPVAFKPNTQYTVSFDVKTVLRSGQTTAIADDVFRFFYSDGTSSGVANKYTNPVWIHKVLTSIAGKTILYVGVNSNEYRSYSYVDINSFQLEEGSTATTYEPYQAQKYIPSADGTVSGVKSLYPITTLMTDTAGVIINAEYNKDLNKAFAELQQAILSMGGNT